jgi:hypothetical protein
MCFFVSITFLFSFVGVIVFVGITVLFFFVGIVVFVDIAVLSISQFCRYRSFFVGITVLFFFLSVLQLCSFFCRHHNFIGMEKICSKGSV